MNSNKNIDNQLYWYRAFVKDVYDGDSITLDIDCGLGVTLLNQKVRLHGIDTPELRGKEREEGLKVKKYVNDLILGKWVLIRTFKDGKGKFGRWIAQIVLERDFISSEYYDSVNQKLIDLGMAERY